LALVNSMGNLAGLVSPTMVGIIREATGSFTSALLFLAGALLIGAVVALLFGYAARPVATPRARPQDLR
jgi:cyanate permease